MRDLLIVANLRADLVTLFRAWSIVLCAALGVIGGVGSLVWSIHRRHGGRRITLEAAAVLGALAFAGVGAEE